MGELVVGVSCRVGGSLLLRLGSGAKSAVILLLSYTSYFPYNFINPITPTVSSGATSTNIIVFKVPRAT